MDPLSLAPTLAAITGFVIAAWIWTARRRERSETQQQLDRVKAELERMEEKLQQAEMKLLHAEKMATLGQLLAGVAHEMNNSVSFISSGLPSLARELDRLTEMIPPETREGTDYLKNRRRLDGLLSAINEGAERSADIVKNLRVFSRVDDDEMQLADLASAIDSTLSLLQHQIRGRIRVVKDYGEIPSIECYSGQLNQVFMNLLANAVQAIDEEGVITVATAPAGPEHVWISVCDTGGGMSEQVQRKAFDSFFTTKPAGVGTGLGLSISRRIIQKHGGSLNIGSTSNAGTEILIRLPIRQTSSEDFDA